MKPVRAPVSWTCRLSASLQLNLVQLCKCCQHLEGREMDASGLYLYLYLGLARPVVLLSVCRCCRHLKGREVDAGGLPRLDNEVGLRFLDGRQGVLLDGALQPGGLAEDDPHIGLDLRTGSMS